MPPLGGHGACNGQEGVCEEHERHVSVPTVPAADFVVIEADLAFGRLEALLDGPAGAGHANQGR